MPKVKKVETLLEKALRSRQRQASVPLTNEELDLLFAFLQGAVTQFSVAKALAGNTDEIYSGKAYTWISNAARRAFQDGKLLREV